MKRLLAFGRQDADDDSEPFNMAYLALRGSGQVSGVSKLHGQVSRAIFQPLFPRWPQEEVPVGSVTNGIHVPTWDSAEADALWTKACGAERWRGDEPNVDRVRTLTDAQLREMRSAARQRMITQVRRRYARQLAARGGPETDGGSLFNAKVLTVGFARRFATYKRPDLLLHDPERLARLLTNTQHPVQMIIAGKAHPEDLPGQELIKRWNDFIDRPDVRGRIVFLSDYDMQMAQELVQGMDLWINTPRRPWEACGTSGMKVLANGGLNVSELDGWWAEAYTPAVGWAMGDGREHGADAGWDGAEAETLYGLLEQQIVPEFYNLDENGMASRWLARVRESMARLTPQFSASRAIREYTDCHYLPAATAYARRAANDGEEGIGLLQWQSSIATQWNTLHFGDVSSETKDGQHQFKVQVIPGGLRADQFKVELYARPIEMNDAPEIVNVSAFCTDATGALLYSVSCPATRPAGEYTARIVPAYTGASVPLEASQILWQR
jgi:starch phosphorylase